MRLVPVKGYEDRYLVSDDGRVFSADRTTKRSDGIIRRFKQKEMAVRNNENGYSVVGLSKGDSSRSYRVHRLMMMSFDYKDGCDMLDVNHKNGVRDDNRLENLEWCTRSENLTHKYRVLKTKHPITGKFGVMHHRSIKITGESDNGQCVSFDSLMDANRAGFSASKICLCLQGKRKHHKGMKWFQKDSYTPPALDAFLGA